MTVPTCLSGDTNVLAAELTIDGLALCCFNQTNASNKFWEVAYPRHKRHTLTIHIEEVVVGRSKNKIIRRKHLIPRNLESFNLRLDTGTNDIYTGFTHGGCHAAGFNRKGTGNDPNDIQWMIDVNDGPEVKHGPATLRRKGGGRVGVTLARLHHSLFFTVRPSEKPIKFAPRCSGDPEVHAVSVGPANREMGALMKAPAAGNLIIEGIPDITDPLPFDASTSYKIEIINDDDFGSEHWPDHVKGDFHLLYDIITVPGTQQELWAAPDKTGRNAPDGDCNPERYSGPTLEPLIA